MILDSGGHALDVAIADVAGVDRTPELTLGLEHEHGGLLDVVLLGDAEDDRSTIDAVVFVDFLQGDERGNFMWRRVADESCDCLQEYIGERSGPSSGGYMLLE